MTYTEQKFNGSMVAEDEVKELKAIADKYDLDYIIATNECFSLLPRKVCTICVTFWSTWKFNFDEKRMAEAANNALGEAMSFCEAHPKYRIADVTATGFDVEQVDD